MRASPGQNYERDMCNYVTFKINRKTGSGREDEQGASVEFQPKPPTAKGPAEWFTGDVWIDSIVRGEEPSRVRVSAVRFTPAARTAWHSHAIGQTLYVTEGRGLVQSRGGDIAEIRPGDVIYTPADEWHWHGAAPDHFMTHLSITEAVAPAGERPEADWGERVTDEEYRAR
jgi:quercetin dioxygenase-like cupin family protein